jgi:nitrogen fixation protein FixH
MRTLLIAVVVIGLVSVAATIIVGTRTFDGTVVGDPYTEGLHWDALRKARLAAGWTMTVVNREPVLGHTGLQVRISDRDGRPLEGARVAFSLKRPETARYDRSYDAKESIPGTYRALVDLPLAGAWNLRTTVVQKERTVVLEDRLTTVKDR